MMFNHFEATQTSPLYFSMRIKQWQNGVYYNCDACSYCLAHLNLQFGVLQCKITLVITIPESRTLFGPRMSLKHFDKHLACTSVVKLVVDIRDCLTLSKSAWGFHIITIVHNNNTNPMGFMGLGRASTLLL